MDAPAKVIVRFRDGKTPEAQVNYALRGTGERGTPMGSRGRPAPAGMKARCLTGSAKQGYDRTSRPEAERA